MFREDACDVVIDHDYFVNLIVPLLGEHSDGGRSAAYSHPLFSGAVDDGRLARLHNDRGTFIDREFDRLAIAQVQQRLTGHGPFAAAASGKMANSAQREHLRTVFTGGDVSYGLALGANQVCFGTEESIGIDLHLDAAV